MITSTCMAIRIDMIISTRTTSAAHTHMAIRMVTGILRPRTKAKSLVFD